MGSPTTYNFFNIRHFISYKQLAEDFEDSDHHEEKMKDLLYAIDFSIGFHGKTYTRVAYTLTAMVGQIGGLCGSIFGIIGALLLPFSYFSFVLYSAGQLFFAKVKENEVFKEDHDYKTEAFLDSTLFTKKEKDEFFNHRPILLNTKNTLMLYFSKLKCCCSASTRSKTEQLEKLYDDASHKL